MTGQANTADPAAAELEGSPLSLDERKRVLSAVRLKLTLTFFVVAVLLVLSTTIYLGVGRIFDWLTPSIRLDLQGKTQRGALELAQSAQLGIVVGDRNVIKSVSTDYLRDPDVLSLVVLDDKGKQLFRHGEHQTDHKQLFRGAHGKVYDIGSVYAAWAPSVIEGLEVGRVILAVSKGRLEAGEQLRDEILTAAALVCLLALVMCLLFVNLYIGPILRVVGEAFIRLERTTEAALQAARLKSQFLANMSHEIRTPMNGIVGVLDLMNRTALNPKQQRYTQTIENSARSLLTIIDDVLDFSRLEAGKYVFRDSDFEVRQMAQDILELLAPKAHAKDIELVQRVDPDVPFSLHGDIDRMKQVLTNLLGNAIKFTERGHVVLHISVTPSEDAADGAEEREEALQLRFTVEDTGVGIAQQDQSKLFGVFSQVDGSLTRKHGGSGLGLAICKRLVEGMGGSIGMQSEEGRSSRFWFMIPIREGYLLPPADDVRPRDARILVLAKDSAQRDAMCELVMRWGMRCSGTDTPERAAALFANESARSFDIAVIDGAFDDKAEGSRRLLELCTAKGLPLIRLLSTEQADDGAPGQTPQLCLTKPVRVSELYNGLVTLLDGVPLAQRWGPVSTQGDDEPRTASRGLVLVVDDNEINRLVAMELLSELGYASDSACNGLEAVQKAERGGFGAILMDCQMPEMDGYEATRRIRAMPGALARVPIIALTAHAMAGDRDRVLRAGMDDYTAKPVRARGLERLLQRWVVTPATPNDSAGDAPQHTAAVDDDAAQADATAAPNAVPSAAEDPATVVLELDPTIPRSARVIEIFLRTLPEQTAILVAAANARDIERVRQLSHKLKGSCLSLGAARLGATYATIERAAVRGELDEAALARTDTELTSLTRILTAKRQSVPAPDASK